MVVVAVAPAALAVLLLPRRIRSWTLVTIGIFGSLVVLGDVLYYRFFGDVLSAPALLAVRQTGHVWGSVRSLMSPALLWLVVDCPVAIWLAARLSRSIAPAAWLTHRHDHRRCGRGVARSHRRRGFSAARAPEHAARSDVP